MGGDALGGVRVVDASTARAGAVAAMMFADHGAEVVKVTDPLPDPGGAVWDRGKRIVAPGHVRLGPLLRGADVLVTSDGADQAVGRALEANPGLVVLRTPSSLLAGTDPSDGMLAARYGIALRQASVDGGPVDSIYPVVTTIQGIWAAACAVAALWERERSGEGQTITVAGEHGVLVAAAGAYTVRDEVLASGAVRARFGPGGSVPFYRTYRCSDGEWLFFAALTPRFTSIGFEVLGLTQLFDDGRLEGRGRAAMITPDHAGWVIESIAEAFARAPRDEWLARLREAGCPAGAVLDRDGWLDHPQVDAIGMRAEVDDPAHGRVVMPGVPLACSDTPGRVRPPLASPDAPDWEPREPSTSASPRADGPLHGVRVLDLGAIIAGPLGASLLGELGADVVKVEPPAGDSFRGPGFAAYNKGQRGVVLDLTDAEERVVFLDLVRSADVVLDNYRPGVLGRLKIDHASLAATNPKVVTASVTGFGDGGPFGSDAGFDPVLQAMSGMMKAQGGSNDPVFFTVPVNDVAAASTVAFGVCLALLHRERTGAAQRVTTSLAAQSCILQAEALVRFDGRPPSPVGSRDHPGPGPLERFYRAADGWIRVGAPHLADADRRLRRAGVRVADGPGPGLEAWARARTRAAACSELARCGIPAVPARMMAEVLSDPELAEHGLVHRDERDARAGYTAGRHAIFSRTMRTGTLVSPGLGEHTREVLRDLGYTPERIDRLVAGATKEPAPS